MAINRRGKATPMTCVVRYLPADIEVTANSGVTLLDAALDNGIDIPHECGGNCACTTCRITVREGMQNLSAIEEVELEQLDTAENRGPAERLSCQALLRLGSVTVMLIESGTT